MNKKFVVTALVTSAIFTSQFAMAEEVMNNEVSDYSNYSQSSKSSYSALKNNYLRLEGGVSTAKYKNKNQALDKSGSGGIAAVAYGQAMADWRMELELYHNFGSKVKKTTTAFTHSLEHKTTALLVNAIYDFRNSSLFTPYVMAGAGYAHNSFSGVAKRGTTVLTKTTRGKSTIGAQVGVGLASRVTDNILFDVRYNVMHKGAELKFSDNTKMKAGFEQAGMAGIRFHF